MLSWFARMATQLSCTLSAVLMPWEYPQPGEIFGGCNKNSLDIASKFFIDH
jgi:hypothetical protein